MISITIISHVFQKSPASREPLQLHPAPPPTSVSQSHDGHVGAPANQHRNRSCGVAAAGVQQEKQTLPEQVSPMSDSSTDWNSDCSLTWLYFYFYFRTNFSHNSNTHTSACHSPKTTNTRKRTEEVEGRQDCVVEAESQEEEEEPACCKVEVEAESNGMGVSEKQRQAVTADPQSPAGSVISISSDEEDDEEEPGAQRHSVEWEQKKLFRKCMKYWFSIILIFYMWVTVKVTFWKVFDKKKKYSNGINYHLHIYMKIRSKHFFLDFT